MIPIGFGIGAAATVVVGSLALGAVLIVTPPAPRVSLWFDQPLTNTERVAGDSLVVVHASSAMRIVQFRVIVSQDSATVAVLNDTSPDAVSFGVPATDLTTGDMVWTAQAGVYVLTPSYLDSSAWVTGTPITVTVTDLTVPAVPDPAPQPTLPATPTSEPTAPPEESTPDTPIDTPATPPPPATVPTPTASPPAAAPPTGTVRRQVSGSTTTFVAEGISPQNAIVDVQYQLTSDYNGAAQPSGSWTSLGCGSLTAQTGTSPTKYTCSTGTWTVPGRASSYRTAHVRVVVTSAGGTTISYGSNWLIEPYIG